MSKLRNIIKRITQPFLKIGLTYYYSKPRKYNYQDIEVLVHPEVFPPHLTLSTKILLDYIVELDLKNNLTPSRSNGLFNQQTYWIILGCWQSFTTKNSQRWY